MRIAVLASGSGTILEAILASGIRVDLVVVDRPCRAVEIAQRHGITELNLERKSFGADFDRDAYTTEVTNALVSHGVDLVVMAGYGTIFGQPIYDEYEGRVLNTHPALLPSFPGWHAVRDAMAYGVKVTGCTVHVATKEVDAGPILAQAPVEIWPDDTEESLHERIKVVEREIYIDTIKSILERGYVLNPTQRQKV